MERSLIEMHESVPDVQRDSTNDAVLNYWIAHARSCEPVRRITAELMAHKLTSLHALVATPR